MDPETVTSNQIETFRRDGVVLLPGLVGDEQLAALAAGVERNAASPSRWAHWYTSPDASVGFWTDYVTWPDVPEYRAVAIDDPTLARVAGELMGSTTVRFFHEHVLVKEPGAVERTPWHHDQPYYCLDGDQSCSMWIALDAVPAPSGLRFLAGSHRWDRWFVPRKFVDHTPYAAADHGFEQVPDVDAELAADPDAHRVVGFDVSPGDVIAFHFRTLHDAPGNQLATRRRAVSLRWFGDDARFALRPWLHSPPFEPDGLVEGEPLDDPRFPLVVG